MDVTPLMEGEEHPHEQLREVVGEQVEEEPRPLLPRWWLCFLPLYWFPQSICWGMIGIYLLPFQVADIVGPKRKHAAYAAMVVCQNVGSFLGPIWGPSTCTVTDGAVMSH